MPVKILVADDSVTMRRVLEMTFAGEDAEVITVGSGEEAVAKASEVRPNVVFADLSLPGVDGYDVAQQIKTTPNLDKTAIILMVSQKSPFDEMKAREKGVDDHIVKPFDTQQIIDRVKQVLAAPRVMPSAGAQPVTRPLADPAAVAQRLKPKTATIGFGVSAASPSAQDVHVGQRTAQQSLPKAPLPANKPAPLPANKPAPKPPMEPKPRSETDVQIAAQHEGLKTKLDALGLKPDQVEAVLALSKEVIEKVVWEVVPDLAETLIREEIKRLTAE